MLRALTLLLAAILATPAAATSNPDRLLLSRSSPEEMTRYAVAHACLGVVARGASLESAVAGSAFPWKPVPGAFALYGTTPNYVQAKDKGGCYFRIDRGDPAALRLAVLDALKEAGASPSEEGAFDSGPDGADGAGKFRQERYCLTGPATAGKKLGVVISTGKRRPPLQVSLFTASDGACA